MKESHFFYTLILLFALSVAWLTYQQESLLEKAKDNLVTAYFVDFENTENSDFALSYQGNIEKEVTVTYSFPDAPEETKTFTLSPKQELQVRPEKKPISIRIEYPNTAGEVQTLTLYKK